MAAPLDDITVIEVDSYMAAPSAGAVLADLGARVIKVEPISGDAAVLHLRTPRTQTLRFMAGQRVRLTDEDGNSAEYPIASCPCDGRNLEFLVGRHPDDEFADGVLARRIKTQVVLVEGPMGEFVLQEESSAPAVFIAYGPGFAPIKSLVEHSISIDRAEHLHLYRIDQPLTGSRLDNLCRAWRDSLDNLSFTRMEREQPAAAVLERIHNDVEDLNRCNVYVAGTAEQIQAFREAVRIAGLNPVAIRFTPID